MTLGLSYTMDMPENLKIIGDHQQNTIDQMNNCLAHGGARAVLCADGHKGYSQPVGGVIAYYEDISISGVGFDIACGNKAAMLNIKGSEIKDKLWPKIADEIARKVSFGVGRTNSEPVDHALFDDDAWKMDPLKGLKQTARAQLGTVGSGNHYLDIFLDDKDNVWIGAHFGSRGLGHKTATHFLLVAGGRDGMDVPPCTVSGMSTIGQDYLEAMRIAGEYAYAGRDYVVDVVAEILGGKIIDQVHNHHNFAWRERHDGNDMWVVRKGATPAFPGQRGFVGGSMGDISVILKGVDSEASKEALYSTVHGAGRVMSRTEAAGKMKWIFDPERGRKMPKRVSEGKVNEASMRQRVKNQGVELRGAGADEAPEVYRPLRDVLKHHDGTIEIELILNPKVVVMAGAGEFDPYKD